MNLIGSLIIIFELAVLVVIGFYLGKTLHFLLIKLFRFFAKKTKSSLDDILMEYIEKPLEVLILVLFLTFTTNFFENLNFVSFQIRSYLDSILILVGAYFLSELTGGLIKWYYEEGKEKFNIIDVTFLPLIRKVTKIVILGAGITFSLASVGIDVTGIFTITAVIGIVLGLASQETLANIFAGIALQLDRPFAYKEYIKFITGEIARVEKIGIRSSKLLDLNGNLIIISNSELAKQRIVNLSRPYNNFPINLALEFPVSLKFDVVLSNLEKYAKKVEEKGLANKGTILVLDSVKKDSYVILVKFSVKNPKDIEEVKKSFNETALGLIQKN
ncbi:MAG: mechanosensitive ion channel family protein [Candidatus Diapherotrites archaeon]